MMMIKRKQTWAKAREAIMPSTKARPTLTPTNNPGKQDPSPSCNIFSLSFNRWCITYVCSIYTLIRVPVCVLLIYHFAPPSPGEREPDNVSERTAFGLETIKCTISKEPFCFTGHLSCSISRWFYSCSSAKRGLSWDLYFIFSFLEFVNFCGVSFVLIKCQKKKKVFF